MDIQVQCCGIVLLLMLLFFFVRHRRIGLYSERVFFITLMFTLGCLTLDVVSIGAIVNREHLAPILLDMICKAYLVSLIWVGYRAMVYVLCDISGEKFFQQWIKRTEILVLIESVIVFLNPIYYYIEGKDMYTYGRSVILTYIFAISYVVATIVITIRSKRIYLRRKIAVNVWLVFWLIAAGIQFMNNQLLLVGYGISLGMVVIFIALENPESNIDRTYGCFHTHAMMRYFDECYAVGKKISIMFLSMSMESEEYMEREQIDKALFDIINFLQKKGNAKVFKLMDQDVVAVFDDMTQMNMTFQEIQDDYYRKQFYPDEENLVPELDFPKSVFVLVPDSTVMRTSTELMALFEYQKMNSISDLRTQVCYVNEILLDDLREKTAIKKEMMQAIEDDRVEVFYQPIYSTKRKKFVAAEALVRIRKTDGSLIPPGKFIPIAEETGIVKQLGEIIFEKVCENLKEGKQQRLGIEYIEINLSVVQFEIRTLAERFIKIMEKHQIDPSWINLEITETASIQTKQNMLENMQRLIKYGVNFTLDDFGNGQSNLDYMIDMPVEIVKLDMIMTQAYFENLKAKCVVEAVVEMVHNMNLRMVAEGVETEEQLAEMERIGIDYIQGYLFSKPVDKNEFIAFLEKNN